MGMPVGLALNFTINGALKVIPMAIEEPSVIAAVSGAAKTISRFSIDKGFISEASKENMVYAQVLLTGLAYQEALDAIQTVRFLF